MLYFVVSDPRPEPPSDAVHRQKAFWDWFGPLRERGVVRHAYARVPRGLVAVFDVESHEALHALLTQWAEYVPASFQVEPLLDPAFKERSVRAAATGPQGDAR